MLSDRFDLVLCDWLDRLSDQDMPITLMPASFPQSALSVSFSTSVYFLLLFNVCRA
jgi:hypothetical protein